MADLDTKALRDAFGQFMTGVTVVTAVAEDGTRVGFTANSFTSVSMDPPLLLVCPGKHLSSLDVFRTCKHFAVQVLADDQKDISNAFARSNGDKFSTGLWSSNEQGVPLLSGALATFSCVTHQNIEAGDHLVLFGRVEIFKTGDGCGLGYWKGDYFSPAKELEPHRSEKWSPNSEPEIRRCHPTGQQTHRRAAVDRHHETSPQLQAQNGRD